MTPSKHWRIQEHMRSGAQLYIEQGIMPGSFLKAVLENNLSEAVLRADHINVLALAEYGAWLSFDIPGDCWGSPEIVKRWAEARRSES